MIKKLSVILIILFSLINTVGCTSETARYEGSFLSLFDTITTIVGYRNSEKEFTEESQFIHDQLEEYHQLYDIYHDYPGLNNIKTVNDQAGIAPVKVDQRLIDLLLFGKEMHLKTNQKVNIAFGSVLNLWHDERTLGMADPKTAKLPSMEVLQKANEHTDINKIIIDETTGTVFLEDPEMQLDLGAIAKGYAVEQVGQKLIEKKSTGVLINVGGNVCALGYKDGKNQLWTVGVQNPDIKNKEKTVETVAFTDASLVTSGVYQRYYTVDGKPYHHIIDPKTLMPSTYFDSVSIIATDSGVADALSTAVFNMPFEEGKAFIENFEEAEAYWIFHDGSIKYSSGFGQYIKK